MRQPKAAKWLFRIGGPFIFVATLMGGYHSYRFWKNTHTITLPVPHCDPHHNCTASLPSGEQIELLIQSTHMPVLTSVRLEVKTKNIPAAKKVHVYFKGAEMNMGEFRYTLTPQKERIYSTQTILPTCIQDNMVWHAIVHIETAHKNYHAPFMLITQRPT